jgi:hypothetical protein
MVRALIGNRLSSFDITSIRWQKVAATARGLSHAEITRACDDAAKAAVLGDAKTISTDVLDRALRVRRAMRPISQDRTARTR